MAITELCSHKKVSSALIEFFGAQQVTRYSCHLGRYLRLHSFGQGGFMLTPHFVVCMVSAAMLFSGADVVFGQDYPTKPIRLIVTQAPGSGMDIMARLVGRKLTDAWGQQVVVDNRPGGGGNIGGEIAAKAAPDGYTLMIVTSSTAIAHVLYEELTYNLVRDFSPISLLATIPFVLVVHPSVAATTVKEMIALAKSSPGKLFYGSSGSGSGMHFAAEIFKTMTRTDVVHVPYKGTNAALVDVMGGRVQLAFIVVSAVLPAVKGGKVRALGVSSLKRTALAPDLPAISESVPGYEVIGWYGLIAPVGTSDEVISRLSGELAKALKTSDFREQLTRQGVEPVGTMPRDFGSFMKSQIRKYREAVRDSGMRVE
jgi:tripartite-type tricarboxylate transporter receptor subunit TctC